MADEHFLRFLKTNGLSPVSVPLSEDDIDFAYSVIESVCATYPQTGDESVPQFLLSHAVSFTQCHQLSTLEEVSQFLCRFHNTVSGYQDSHYEFLLFTRFLSEDLKREDFAFYLKVVLGDEPQTGVRLEELMVQARDWVQVSTSLFSGTYTPTASVQHISERLLSLEESDSVPAVNFLEACMDEIASVTTRKHEKDALPRKAKAEPLSKLFYKRPSGLLNLLPRRLPEPPKPQIKKSSLPDTFNILDFGKLPYQDPGPKRQEQTLGGLSDIDEELFHASSNEPNSLPRASQLPMKVLRLSNTFSTSSDDLERVKQENEYLAEEFAKAKAALEESIAFCDQVSIEHDMLLLQNAKIKRLLSVVTDKLIRTNPGLIKDLDFGDVINDPCKEFKQTGILKELQLDEEGEKKEEIDEELEMPFTSEVPKKKKAPVSPTFTKNQGQNQSISKKFIDGEKIESESSASEERKSDQDVYISILAYSSTHPKMLSFPKGTYIRKISEAQGWWLGENQSSGERGYFPPSYVTQ